MTTIIAYKGVMAADSKETDTHEVLENHSYVVTTKSKKIWRLPDGRIFGGAGSSEDIQRLLTALKKKQPPPALENVSGLLLNTDGSLELYEGHIWIKVRETPYYAIGTGAAYAVAAMRALLKIGKGDAKIAARIGADMDPFSGGAIRTLSVLP